MSTRWETFRIAAQNLPEHARNTIHTDAGAQAAGFPRALVAGVTTYAYLTHPPAAAWGLDWLRSGGGEVRFRSPVFDGDVVDCVPVLEADSTGDDVGAVTVQARVGGVERARAELRAVLVGGPCAPLRSGEALETCTVVLDGEWGSDYGARAGDDLALYSRESLVHPAVWLALANQIVHHQVARGAWIHLRSIVRHHALVVAGSTAAVHAVVVRRYDRGGERAVLDVHVEVDGAVVASVEHEAIVALPA